MATAKKATNPGKAPKANSKPKTARSVNPTAPVRIIIEVVIRNETAGTAFDKSFKGFRGQNLISEEAVLSTDFSYSFERSGCTILKLSVETFQQDNPPDSGSFSTTLLDPNVPPTINVVVLARQDTPGGNGRLSLKYNGKDVFSPAEEIQFSGGIGFIHKSVKLPI